MLNFNYKFIHTCMTLLLYVPLNIDFSHMKGSVKWYAWARAWKREERTYLFNAKNRFCASKMPSVLNREKTIFFYKIRIFCHIPLHQIFVTPNKRLEEIEEVKFRISVTNHDLKLTLADFFKHLKYFSWLIFIQNALFKIP